MKLCERDFAREKGEIFATRSENQREDDRSSRRWNTWTVVDRQGLMAMEGVRRPQIYAESR